MRQAPWAARLPLVLWPLGIAAEMVAFVFLFRDTADVTAVDVVNRSVGGSFVACGLIAWQLRRDSRIGPLMTLTGFVFLLEAVLSGIDSSVAYTLGQWSGNWWTVPFAALVLSFPSGRLSSRIDWAIVGAFVFGVVVLQLVWLLFLPFPPGKENVFLISADADLANVIDRFESSFNATVGLALAVVAISRWVRAAPPLRRLLLPTLAGGVTALILVVQIYYDLLTGEFIRSSQQVTAVLLVSVPLAFLFGMLHQQLARAGMADLVVALQRAPESHRLGESLGKALGDPSLVLAYWLPRFNTYVDAEGTAVSLPEAGSGRTATFVDRDGHHVAALVHDAALAHQPDLLEVVCAAANVALERERLQAELEARVVELRASRVRIVTAGDAERRRLERDLHDGAQQRLVGIALQLSLLKGRIKSDPATAEQLVNAAGDELALSLAELRELARGIHPAVLEHGLAAALESLAARAAVPTKVSFEPSERLPEPVELAAYFVASEALANVAKYAHATAVSMRVRRNGQMASIEIADDGIGGADDRAGSGLRGLADRVEALEGHLRVTSPAGAGTVITAELPCAARPPAVGPAPAA
jgi:signal transduction histidine kinase